MAPISMILAAARRSETTRTGASPGTWHLPDDVQSAFSFWQRIPPVPWGVGFEMAVMGFG